MNKVVLYTTRFCPYCVRAKALLNRKGVEFEEIAVDNDQMLRREMMAKSGRHTVPQIWIGEQHVGGCDELYTLEKQGKLDQALELDTP
ncbi:glutaredoxin 3 [Alkalimarinus sediminis]|uniref:Glutaredoxin n=1 Tax=Alkalimarinus sediminis TaxID=1632866 RepID=A0A9E8HJG4_9ALTE|nr:glutaredoxin 3 [Alkalimarinus sediminis]UZW75475.1 glutaredoxin 3 [Alkalimarinus sediminis]